MEITIIMQAATAERAELMFKILDAWTVVHFNVYGNKRITSGQIGGRYAIIAQTTTEIWNYVRHGYLLELPFPVETYEPSEGTGVIIKELA